MPVLCHPAGTGKKYTVPFDRKGNSLSGIGVAVDTPTSQTQQHEPCCVSPFRMSPYPPPSRRSCETLSIISCKLYLPIIYAGPISFLKEWNFVKCVKNMKERLESDENPLLVEPGERKEYWPRSSICEPCRQLPQAFWAKVLLSPNAYQHGIECIDFSVQLDF